MEQTGEVGRGAAPARSRRATPDARRVVQRRRPAAAGTSGEARERKVRERAHHAIWEREGRPCGAAVRHWAMAEANLWAERSARPGD
jgi:Protein of unknown function (DUF2934)